MKLKTLFLVALATFALSISAETTYQKKANQIYEKYYTLFKDGYSHGLNMTESIMFSMDPEAMTAMAAMSALKWFPMNRLNQYINQMERELEEAESLMTPEERKKKAEQDAIKARKKTSVGYLELAIQTNLIPWATKGEFEKTTDYQKRLQEEGNTRFITACNEYFPEATFDVRPLKYDADKEQYDFEIKYNLQFIDKSFSHEIMVTIPMNVDAARRFSQFTPKILVTECVWGTFENNITPQSYKIAIDKTTFAATTKASNLIINGSEILPSIPEFKSLIYNYSDSARLHIEKEVQYKAHLLSEIDQYNRDLMNQEANFQKLIQSSPYFALVPDPLKDEFLHPIKIERFSEDDDISTIEEYYNQIQKKKAEASVCDPLLPVKQYLIRNNKEKYVEVFFKENPDSAQFLQQEWLEYKCHSEYEYIHMFVVAYMEGRLESSKRDCRQQAWYNYGDSYGWNRSEFDADFDKGEDVIQKHVQLCHELELKITAIRELISSMNLQGANESKDKNTQEVIQIYNELAAYPKYQEKVANVITTTNVKARKEFEKNGALFSSKIEFITAYFKSDYKMILKSKK